MKGLFRLFIILFLLMTSQANAASVITYTLNAAPALTDQLILIDDPAGSWAVNRVAVSSILSLLTDSYVPDVITVGAGSTVANSTLDADLQIYAGITPAANVQSLLGAANYAAIRALLDLEAGTDFYSIAAADAAFEPAGITESDVSDLGTTTVLTTDASLSGYSWFLDEDAMTSNSATKVPSQQSVKAYVDAKKLDDLAAPDDNTDRNVSITAHGLCPKAPNDTTQWLRGDGTWAEGSYKDYALTIRIPDIDTAKYYYIPVPVAGYITLIQSVIDGAITTANTTLTCYIRGLAITDGVVTIGYSGSAAGDYDSATPSAANTVASGNIIRIYCGGETDATGVSASLTFTIER